VDLLRRIGDGTEPSRDQVIGLQDTLRVRQTEWFPGRSLSTLETAAFLRTRDWRYVEWLNRNERALYRIEEDPFERTDVGPDHPELLVEFAARTALWRDVLLDPAEWIDLTGRLTSPTDTPVAGLRLWLTGATPAGVRVTLAGFSDDGGFFRLPNVPAGRYVLTYEIARPEGGAWRRQEPRETRSLAVDLVGYQTGPFLPIEVLEPSSVAPLSSETGTIEIQLTSRGNVPTTAIPLRIIGWTRTGLVDLRTLSGPDAFVALDRLPAGIYSVAVETGTRVDRRAHWLRLRPGATEHREIRVGRRARPRPKWHRW
jgi:hypothetical protein